MQVFARILQGSHVRCRTPSDVHLKVDSPVIFRVAGDLVPVEAPLPTAEWFANDPRRRLVPEHLRARLEQDHEVDFAYDHLPGVGRFRVNVFQQRGGHVMALRLVKGQVRNFEELHLPPVIRRVAEATHGIVLLTGATGSGKSTTLAAMIEHINVTAKKHIITLEDLDRVPIRGQAMSRHRAARSRHRHGQLCVRLEKRAPPGSRRHCHRRNARQFQRVRRHQRGQHRPPHHRHAPHRGRREIGPAHPRVFPRPGSGNRCASSSPRRSTPSSASASLAHPRFLDVPAVEVLINTAAVAKLIHTGTLEKLPAAIELGTGDGMQTFDQALYDLVNSGKITQQEALANSPTPEALKMRFQGVILSESRRILSARWIGAEAPRRWRMDVGRGRAVVLFELTPAMAIWRASSALCWS